MLEECSATVIGGHLMLDQPLSMPDNSRIVVLVDKSAPEATTDKSLAWKELKEFLQSHPVHGGGKKFNREELYDRN